MSKKNNLFFLTMFLVISIAILLAGNQYKNYKVNEYTSKKYSSLANSITNEVSTLIKEKKNATLAVAISFSKSAELKHALLKDTKSIDIIRDYSEQLKKETDFKNVWVQLVDKNGVSLSRNWSDISGDNLSKIREDVRSMNNKPEIKSSISVGRFDMSFKAMVPIFDSDKEYIGFIEVITHFNSISKKIKKKDFEPVVLVNEKYKKQITNPFTKKFAGDNYVANIDADDEIVEFIQKQGLKHFISPYKNYIIEEKKDDLVINYTLFDKAKEPMANFLVFKKIQNIDMSSAESIKHTVELLTILSVVLTAILFYILSNKEEIKLQGNENIDIFIFVVLFLFLAMFYYLTIDWNFDQKRDKFFKQYNQNIQKDYEIIHNKFSTVAQTLFYTVIDKPAVLDLVSKAYDDEQKTKARDELYSLLSKDYEYFKTYNLRQLHFHLKNNESFLRFHRPEKFGDSLVGVRSTVVWVNANKEKIEGFEEGRIFNGFRYVFPLTLKTKNNMDKHIGSVETSFSAYAIAKEYANVYQTKANFIVKENVIDAKVFKEEQSNYLKSPFEGFMYEKTINNQFELSSSQINIDLLSQEAIKEASKRIFKGKVFSIQSKNENIIFTFFPFKNPVSKKVVASIILQQENYELSNQNNLRMIFLLAGIVAIMFVLLYIYKEFSSKHRFRLLSLKTQNILDAQTSMVVITDGKQILDANKKILEYFGCSDIERFKNDVTCMCEIFEKDDRFFHLDKVPKGELWVDAIEKLPHKDHIVAMKDINNKVNIFFIYISHFDNNIILSFNNINETMTEQFSLIDRVSHDKLTGAYSRDFFDTRKELWIEELKYTELKLGVIMLDIDHFKIVNDTYGHNLGDQVLKRLVSLIKTTIRQEDMLVRWGGEEFIIVSNVSSLDDLQQIAENIREKIEKEVFEQVGSVTCSFGVTIYNDEPIEYTIERADKALYEAKGSGRNCVVAKGVLD